MAAAAATLSESTPVCMGIVTRRSAPLAHRWDSPAPSVPSSTATGRG